jgi:hypothetical protein
MTFRDIYVLGASSPFVLKGREEVTVNLRLQRQPLCCHTLLTGCVLYNNYPVPGAEVLVLNRHGCAVAHAFTDECGRYRIYGLKPGAYMAAASAKGYKTSGLKRFKIRADRRTLLSFCLKKSPDCNFGLVYGSITDALDKKPAAGAVCCLRENCGAEYRAVTNCEGQFLIYGVLPGVYTVSAYKRGYKVSRLQAVAVGEDERLKISLKLKRELL